jgi:hypothetical protein
MTAPDTKALVALRAILAAVHQPNPTDPSRYDVAPGKHRAFQAAIADAKAALEATISPEDRRAEAEKVREALGAAFVEAKQHGLNMARTGKILELTRQAVALLSFPSSGGAEPSEAAVADLRDRVHSIIAAGVSSEADVHFVDRRWLRGVAEVTEKIIALFRHDDLDLAAFYHTTTDRLQAIGEKYGCEPGENRLDWLERFLAELTRPDDEITRLGKATGAHDYT